MKRSIRHNQLLYLKTFRPEGSDHDLIIYMANIFEMLSKTVAQTLLALLKFNDDHLLGLWVCDEIPESQSF